MICDPEDSHKVISKWLTVTTSEEAGQPHCFGRLYRSSSTGYLDYCGAFCVSTGFGTQEKAAAFEAENDDYSSIMIKALADRLAEAF